MSQVTEAHITFIIESVKFRPFYGVVIHNSRRVGKSSMVYEFVEMFHTEWLDEKMALEAEYCKGHLERFKQDVLPEINKKILGHDSNYKIWEFNLNP